MERQISIVEYFYDEDGEESKGRRCGYCKSSGTSISQGGLWPAGTGFNIKAISLLIELKVFFA